MSKLVIYKADGFPLSVSSKSFKREVDIVEEAKKLLLLNGSERNAKIAISQAHRMGRYIVLFLIGNDVSEIEVYRTLFDMTSKYNSISIDNAVRHFNNLAHI